MFRLARSAMRLAMLALLSGAWAMPSGANTLWYNGDPAQSGSSAESFTAPDAESQWFDDFVVTSASGWTVHSVWASHAFLDGNPVTVTSAKWEIRTGVTPGVAGTQFFTAPGTFVAGGVAPATVTPTGQYFMGPEYIIEVTGLNVNLGPGTYWLSVAPEIDNDQVGAVWINQTLGANAVGTWNQGNSYVWSPTYSGSFWFSRDFSMGVAGEVNAEPPDADVTPPTVGCPADFEVTCASALGKVVSFTVTATDDQDPAPAISSTPASGSAFPVGSTLVNSTATDNAGNISVCQFTVTVLEDALPPTLDAPAPIEWQGTTGDDCNAVISDAELGIATATDACSDVQVSRSGVPEGNLFPPGTTVITWQATDEAGNMASATQAVTVSGGPGTIAGHVTASCPSAGTALQGVHVDVFDGFGTLVATATTDAAGAYSIGNLPTGSYTATVVTPLGYQSVNDDVQVTLSCGSEAVADFALNCVTIVANPRTQGYWKHQVGVATGGPGTAQVDGATLCSLLDLIEDHFNSNAINQVIVYEPPASGTCSDKLLVAKELLNLRGSAGMTARAKQQLMALLLNVAAGYISLQQVISVDGATVSQAITRCDLLIDGNASEHETAKTIADLINNNRMVPAGMIPSDTTQIAYRRGQNGVAPFELSQNLPNPFGPQTSIRFKLSKPAPYALSIFDASGRLVRRYEGTAGVGEVSISWDGREGNGARVAAGIYHYRLEAEGVSAAKRMLLLN